MAACCGPHDAAQLLQLAADGPEARRRLSKEHPELGAAVDVDCHAPHSSLASRVGELGGAEGPGWCKARRWLITRPLPPEQEEEVCSASSTGMLERDPSLAVEDTQLVSREGVVAAGDSRMPAKASPGGRRAREVACGPECSPACTPTTNVQDACLAFVEPALEARFGTWFAERQGGTDTILLGLSMLSWVLGLLHSRHSTLGTAVLLGLSLVHAAVLVVRF